ncbi:intraflagellar transport protein 27 homolog [Amia ocellicauda]|uniref:intraflagellar transport protein 27 homolog n=1 Tax=Amia ocellicauda TaxID=2972642 RepID=UPI003464113E
MVKLRAKCILAGNAAVGKTALVQMFLSDGAHFQKNYSMSAGVEVVVKTVSIPDSSDSVELFIFDSAGREVFLESCEKLWAQASVLCVVFDVTSELSFTRCAYWLDRVRQHCQDPQAPGVLVGNKVDLEERREVEAGVARDWAQSQGLEYFETSAKEMQSFELPFLGLAQTFHRVYQDRVQALRTLA